MKNSTGILALLTSSFVFAGVSLAQDAQVAAEKRAVPVTLLPNSYGKVELRHVFRRNTENEVTRGVPSFALRPTLGTKFLNDRLDTNFTGVFTKRTGQAKIEKTDLYNITTYKLLGGQFGSVSFYSETRIASKDQFVKSDELSRVGLDFAGNYPINTKAGVIEFAANTTTMGVFNIGKNREESTVTERTSSRFSLTEKDKKYADREPSLENWTTYGITFKPVKATGLALSASSELDATWKPRYIVRDPSDNSTGLVYEKEGYKITRETINTYAITYDLSDKVKLSNQVLQRIGGYYGERLEKGGRWENRLALTSTLF